MVGWSWKTAVLVTSGGDSFGCGRLYRLLYRRYRLSYHTTVPRLPFNHVTRHGRNDSDPKPMERLVDLCLPTYIGPRLRAKPFFSVLRTCM